MSIFFIFIKFVIISHLVVIVSLIGMRLVPSLKLKRYISLIAIVGSLLGLNSFGGVVESLLPEEELRKIATSGSLVFKMMLAMLAVYLLLRILKVIRNFKKEPLKILLNVFNALLLFSPVIKMFCDQLYLLEKQLEDETVIVAGGDRDRHVEKLLAYSEEESQSKIHYQKRVDALYEKKERRLIQNIVVVTCVVLITSSIHYLLSISQETKIDHQLSPKVVTTGYEDRYLVQINNIKIKDGDNSFSLRYKIKSDNSEEHKQFARCFQSQKILSKIYEIFAQKDHNEIIFSQNQIQRKIDMLVESKTQMKLQSTLELLF